MACRRSYLRGRVHAPALHDFVLFHVSCPAVQFYLKHFLFCYESKMDTLYFVKCHDCVPSQNFPICLDVFILRQWHSFPSYLCPKLFIAIVRQSVRFLADLIIIYLVKHRALILRICFYREVNPNLNRSGNLPKNM